MPLLDPAQSDFELHIWGLKNQPTSLRRWFQSAWKHDQSGLETDYWSSWPDRIDGVDPLHLFACGQPRSGGLRQSRAVLHWILRHGGRMDKPDACGWLPVNYAAWFGHAATMDVLLEAGSPIGNPKGPQPLDSALMSISQTEHQGSETCARLLLMHGANPNGGFSADPHYGGVTWLTWALEKERWDWAEMLWARGQKSITDRELHMLVIRGASPALAWLQHREIDVVGVVGPSYEFFQELYEIKTQTDRAKIIAGVEDFLAHHLGSPSPDTDPKPTAQHDHTDETDGEGESGESGTGETKEGRQEGGRRSKKM